MSTPASPDAQVICSSRDLFGSDRSALRLVRVLNQLGLSAGLVVPRQRPDRGLGAACDGLGIAVTSQVVAIASSKGLSGVRGLMVDPVDAGLAIFNTSAIIGGGRKSQTRIMMLREWISSTRPEQQLLMRYHARRLDGLVAVSSAVLQQVDHLVPDRVQRTVIPNWLDEVRPFAGRNGREGIVCVGRFNQWKGQQTLATAWDRAFAGVADPPSLTFVGAEDPPSPFAKRAESLRLRAEGKPWRVLPFTEDVYSVLATSALFVLPSERPEPFGNVILEALNAGCEVLSFSGGGPDDLARTFPENMRIVPRSIPALAGGLREWFAVRSACPVSVSETVESALRAKYSHDAAVAAWGHFLHVVGYG